MRAPLAIAAPFAALALGACTVDELDLTGRQCPCITGYVCVESLNLCVEGDGGGPTEMDGGRPPGEDGGPPPPPPDDGGPPPPDDGGMVVDMDSGPPPPVDGGGPLLSNCDGPFGTRLFCDGFEDGTIDAWDGADPLAMWSIVDDPVYMGNRALRVFGDIGSTYAGIYKAVYPDTAVDQWLRAYYWFPAADGFGVEVNAMAEYDFAYDLVVSVGSTQVNFHSHSVDPAVSATVAAAVAPDRWICIELHTHFGATDGAVEVFFDGIRVLEQSAIAFTPPRGLAMVMAGFRWKDATVANTVYVDEVVADTSRIGCD